MKRIVVCAALLAAAVPSSAWARDAVSGTGVNGGKPVVNAFFVLASADSDGQDAGGMVGYVDHLRLRVLTGSVACVNVSGKVANVVFRYETQFNQPPDFGAVGNLTRIKDNGTANAEGFADFLSNGYLRDEAEYEAALARCRTAAPLPPRQVRITAGDLRVVDDGPL